MNFNPRTHRGVRLLLMYWLEVVIIFQSTHPSWGATNASISFLTLSSISIHAPIVGCDYELCWHGHAWQRFQSTHPSWGATLYDILMMCGLDISIHAPIVGCDASGYLDEVNEDNFNPRTHRGVRHLYSCWICNRKRFQSTHPSWGATYGHKWGFKRWKISIHAPIVGCDIF